MQKDRRWVYQSIARKKKQIDDKKIKQLYENVLANIYKCVNIIIYAV